MSGIVPWGRQSPTFAPLVPYRQEVGIAVPQPSPTAPNSWREWWRELKGETEQHPTAIQSAVVGLRQNAEGAAIGALLAFVDTDLGGLDLGGRIPLDWAGAAL